VVVGLLLVAFITNTILNNIPTPNKARADANKVVSLASCGTHKIITTDAATVGEVLSRAGIALSSGDVVEPGVDTPIANSFFNINVYCSQPYRITDGGTVTHVLSAQQAPKLIAADAGVTVYPEDKVTFAPVSNFVSDQVVGQNIVIDRADVINMVADGKSVVMRTHTTTIGEFLAEKGIVLGEKDTVVPGAEMAITNGMAVRVTRVSVVVTTKEEPIAKPTQRISDPNALRGNVVVRSEGADGKQKVTYELTYHNGEVVKSRQLAVERLEEPKPRVEVVGTKVFYPNEMAALAGRIAAERGWDGDQWDALFNLWEREAHFNPAAVNPSSGACGIPQAYPCSKLPGFPNDPEAQIRWGLNYIANRYGTPVNAWAYWQRNHSY
jgi:resuscitation-promoting factor RpfB